MMVLLPKLGFAMNEGRLTEWLAKDGDVVKEGDPLYGLESEKSVQEVEAPATGVLRIKIEPSEDSHEVGTVLAEIVEQS